MANIQVDKDYKILSKPEKPQGKNMFLAILFLGFQRWTLPMSKFIWCRVPYLFASCVHWAPPTFTISTGSTRLAVSTSPLLRCPGNVQPQEFGVEGSSQGRWEWEPITIFWMVLVTFGCFSFQRCLGLSIFNVQNIPTTKTSYFQCHHCALISCCLDPNQLPWPSLGAFSRRGYRGGLLITLHYESSRALVTGELARPSTLAWVVKWSGA